MDNLSKLEFSNIFLFYTPHQVCEIPVLRNQNLFIIAFVGVLGLHDNGIDDFNIQSAFLNQFHELLE